MYIVEFRTRDSDYPMLRERWYVVDVHTDSWWLQVLFEYYLAAVYIPRHAKWRKRKRNRNKSRNIIKNINITLSDAEDDTARARFVSRSVQLIRKSAYTDFLSHDSYILLLLLLSLSSSSL